jgi:hypothetical protein
MTLADLITTVLYPSLALIVTAGTGAVVIYIKSMAATAQASADAAALTGALARGKALAEAQGASPAELPAKVADYLHQTSPDLAQRTGMAMTTQSQGAEVLVPTAAGAARIAATLAEPATVGASRP